MLKQFLLLGLLITVHLSQAQQDKTNDYLLQQEQIRKTAMLRELDSGVYYLDEGRYVQADGKFRYVLDNIKSVPSDLVFYFGKNSFYLGKYHQCIDWLNKYIQLKGTTGQFSQEAIQWLKKAEAEILNERKLESKKAEEILSINYDIDCGPSGKVICPVCKGEHVIIKSSVLKTEYKTCPYCNEHGILTCEEYNKLVRGELKPKF